MSLEKSAINRLTNVGSVTTSAKSLTKIQNRQSSPYGIKKNVDYNPLVPKAVPKTEVPPTPE